MRLMHGRYTEGSAALTSITMQPAISLLDEHTIVELLRTGKALEKLPLFSQAYEKGGISSTHVRENTRAATPETEILI